MIGGFRILFVVEPTPYTTANFGSREGKLWLKIVFSQTAGDPTSPPPPLVMLPPAPLTHHMHCPATEKLVVYVALGFAFL